MGDISTSTELAANRSVPLPAFQVVLLEAAGIGNGKKPQWTDKKNQVTEKHSASYDRYVANSQGSGHGSSRR